MSGHETNLDEFNRTKIIENAFSDHNGMSLELSNKRKLEKFINMWELKPNHKANKTKPQSTETYGRLLELCLQGRPEL